MITQSNLRLVTQEPVKEDPGFIGAEEAIGSIANGEFVPHFQPIVILRTGQLAGFEALARWQHPVRGSISPEQFIPQAEKHGWIDALSREILRRAFASAALIPDPLMLSVNVSPVQLRDSSLPQQIRDAAALTGFALNRVKVEITESALTGNLAQALSIAQELKEMGCRLALDDFGTGYSSLLHLQSLPFDELKIDRSFVTSMVERRENRKIVVAIVGLGQSLRLTTVAEGVETQQQEDMLLWMGCELGQGWCYGKPVPAEELPLVISKRRKDASSRTTMLLYAGSHSTLDALPAQRLAQLQAVYDGAPVGLAFLDRNLRHMSLNQRLADMNHVGVQDHIGKTIAEVLPDVFPYVEPYLRRALQGEAIEGIEIRIPASGTSEESIRLASYQPAHDEVGEVVGVSVAVIDITERKHVEEALRESEECYRSMVELNPQIPWTMDANGQNLDISPRFEALTGLTKEQTRGHGWLTALHPDDLKQVTAALASLLATGLPVDVEYRLRAKSGAWRWMRSRGAPRYDDEGHIVCWYGVLEDIDELKGTRAELLACQTRFNWPLIPHLWEAFWHQHRLFGGR